MMYPTSHVLICGIISFLLKLESLVQDMQDKTHGVPVRHQKVFLSSIPCAFMGKEALFDELLKSIM